MHVDPSATLKRLWAVLRLIPAWPQGITVSALRSALQRQRFNPGRTTVERDLKTLSRDFELIVDTSGKTHRWSWATTAAIQMLPRPTVSQCLALALCKQHMGDLLPQSMRDDLEPLFDAAERELAHTEWKDWPRLTAVAPAAFALLPPKIEAKVLTDAQHALARRVVLTANYRSIGTKSAKRRTIHPLGMLVRGTVQYLVALLPEHPDEPRQLAVHRMRETVVSSEPCKRLHGFSMARYVRKLAISPRGTIRLRAVFARHACEHMLGTPISKYQTWRPIGDTDKVEVCATVVDDKQMLRWLLGFGADVEVIEPAHLRTEITEELEKALQAYRSPSARNEGRLPGVV